MSIADETVQISIKHLRFGKCCDCILDSYKKKRN